MFMEIRSQKLACLLWISVVLALPAQAATEVVVDEEIIEIAQATDIEEEALFIVKAMSEVLAAANDFDYQIETAFDVVQQSGTKIEFGASRQIQVSRPARMRMEVQQRDGTRSEVVFDGENIWAYVPEQNVYAKTEQHGDLIEAIEYAVDELGMEAPLQSLVSADFYETVLDSGLTRALWLEDSVVAGVPCDHLLLSNDYTDFQLWISQADEPVLQRVVITYRHSPGEPQFQAQFIEWNFSPERKKGQFKFAPPEGSNQVRFYVPAPATNLDQEDEQ